MNPSIDLEAAKAAFLASGGSIIALDGYQYVPHRPHRDIEQVRAVQPRPLGVKEQKRQKQLVELREMAKTMTYAQAMERTGLAQSTLYRAAQDGGFAFQPDPRRFHGEKQRAYADPAEDKALAQQIAALRDDGLNRSQAKARLGISDRKFCRVIHMFGVDYPKAEGKRCDGPNLKAQVRQRRRQEQFHMPPSGLSEHRHAESTFWSGHPAGLAESAGEEAVQHPQRRTVPA